jgi:hypothetical protein
VFARLAAVRGDRRSAERAKDLAPDVIDSFPALTADVEKTARCKRRLLKEPEEFRYVRVDRAKKMTRQGSIDRNETHVNFEAPGDLHKWPSLGNERRTDGTGPI